ncbi:uncharacterized protein LOC134766388 [Penaeus indicus]|uniref:uncharacterized protein LOC134766388 n=1 Tax=Penaeus indicus TaxID=29960 RepID=UPI00300D82A5
MKLGLIFPKFWACALLLMASVIADLQEGKEPQQQTSSCVAKGGICVKDNCQNTLSDGECEDGEVCCDLTEASGAEEEAGKTREKRGAGSSADEPQKGSEGSDTDKGQNQEGGAGEGGAEGPTSSFCKTSISICKTQGGICVDPGASSCSYTKFPIHQKTSCRGLPCTCCVEEPTCSSNSYCAAEGGYCSDSCGRLDRVLDGMCGSSECKCCAPPCKTQASCFQKGGVCVTNGAFCSGTLTPECGGSGCMCCVNNIGGCTARLSCTQNGGVCSTDGCTDDEDLIEGGCLGEGCTCCAPRPCVNSRTCRKRGGQCVRPADCPDSSNADVVDCTDGCVCCVDCRIRTPCSRSSGFCTKSRCKRNEITIRGGCRGKKCRCCAPSDPCARTGRACTVQGGSCRDRAQCTVFNNSRGCRSGIDCVCCLDGKK